MSSLRAASHPPPRLLAWRGSAQQLGEGGGRLGSKQQPSLGAGGAAGHYWLLSCGTGQAGIVFAYSTGRQARLVDWTGLRCTLNWLLTGLTAGRGFPQHAGRFCPAARPAVRCAGQPAFTPWPFRHHRHYAHTPQHCSNSNLIYGRGLALSARPGLAAGTASVFAGFGLCSLVGVTELCVRQQRVCSGPVGVVVVLFQCG